MAVTTDNIAVSSLPPLMAQTPTSSASLPPDAGGNSFPPLLSSILATGNSPCNSGMHGNQIPSIPLNPGLVGVPPTSDNPSVGFQSPKDVPAPSFATVLRPNPPPGPLDPDTLVPPSMKPVRKGLYLMVAIDDALRTKGIEELKGSFIARITHAKTETPLARLDLEARLSDLWKLNSRWSMVHLGKGYYNIMIDNLEDRDRIFRRRTWSIKPGFMRLMPWVPNFDPYNVNTSVAQVWIRLFQLPLEYWQDPIIVALASAVGMVIRLDDVTRQKESAHFARVLVEVDLKKDLEEYVMIESSGHRSYVMIQYERLPSYCRNCTVIGHDTGDFFSRNQSNSKTSDRGPRTYNRADKQPAISDKNENCPQGVFPEVNPDSIPANNNPPRSRNFEIGETSGASPSPTHMDPPAGKGQPTTSPCLPPGVPTSEPPTSKPDHLEESPNCFALLAMDTDNESLQEGFPNDPLDGETDAGLPHSPPTCQEKTQKKRGRKKKQPAPEHHTRPYNLRNSNLEETSQVVREATNGNFVVETGTPSHGLLEMTRVTNWAEECERSTPPTHGALSVTQ
ncbi:hypothetical protein ACS0TY_031028 [Phlomoides rotata]